MSHQAEKREEDRNRSVGGAQPVLRRSRIAAGIFYDGELRLVASGVWTVVFDVAYAAFTLVTGLQCDSGFAVAVALYHVAIAGLGLVLTHELLNVRKLDERSRETRELSLMRKSAALLIVSAIFLTGVMVEVVKHGMAQAYGSGMALANAGFVFINVGMAARSMVLAHRTHRPLLVAVRATMLSKTFVQVFFLVTTMISSFGRDVDLFLVEMGGATGAIVLLALIAIALSLLVYAHRKDIRMKAAADPGIDDVGIA